MVFFLIPKGTYHRSISDKNVWKVLNQALRDKSGTVESEFKVINSLNNKELLIVLILHNLKPNYLALS